MGRLLLATFLLSTHWALGQLSIGARVAGNYSDLKISNYQHPIVADISTSSDFGYAFGFYAKASVLKFYVQPEIVFAQINADIDILLANEQQLNYRFKLNRLDVPIPVGFEFGAFNILAGPVASFNLNPGASLFNNTYNQGVWSFMAGAGVRFNDFMLEFRYESAMENHADQAELIIGEELYRVDMDARISLFVFTVGYTF